jgi:hypothetical protein
MKATVKLLLQSARISFFYIHKILDRDDGNAFPLVAAQAKRETADKESTNESQNVVCDGELHGRIFVRRLF